MNLILLGPPYSGKSTQSKKLCAEFGLYHVATGDILRSEISIGSPLGKQVEQFVMNGLFAPDEILEQVVRKEFFENINFKGFLLDGYPRNSKQMETLLSMFKEKNLTLQLVIVLDVPEKEWLSRANNRAKVENRQDDKDTQIVKKRFELYNLETLPIIEIAQRQNLAVANIYAVGSNEDVFERINKQIKLINI
jgi:adenylate kinase